MTPSQRERLRFAYQHARFMRPDAARYLRPQFVERKFSVDQPRVPAGNPDGGQWTDGGGFPTDISAQSRNGSGGKPPLKIIVRPRPGMGHNNGPALEDPPDIPPEEPRSRPARSAVVKGLARWMAAAIKLGFAVALTLPPIQGALWIARYLPAIRSYSDPPRTLDELHDAVSHPRPGYEIHHNVEQTSAEGRVSSEHD